MFSVVHGGSNVINTKHVSTSSNVNTFSLTSLGKLSATGQFGEVNVIDILTSFSIILTSYINPNSYMFTGISGSYTVFITEIIFSTIVRVNESIQDKKLDNADFKGNSVTTLGVSISHSF